LLGLFLHERNNFNYQELIDSTDGIFRVSPTNSYYYEKRIDRIVVPLYVKSTQSPLIQYGTIASSLTNSNTIETLFNITLIDCNVHMSCVSCMSLAQCSWCSNKCINTKTLVDNQSIKPESCNKYAGMCESFDTGTNKLLIPYTAHRQQAPLILSLLNLNNTSLDLNEMKCLFTMFNGKFLDKNVTLPFGMINKTHGHCSLANVFEYLSIFIDEINAEMNNTLGQVQTNLRLYNSKSDTFIDSTSNGKLALLFYKCEIKANDCSQCLSLNRQFSCMWCNVNPILNGNNDLTRSNSDGMLAQSSCRFMNVQSKLRIASQCILPISTGLLGVLNNNSQTAFANFNQCDKPQITDIQPSKLPIGGGTLLTISGVNLGSSKEDIIFVNINCGGQSSGPMSKNANNGKITIKCDLMPLKYVPSKKIVCKTRQSTTGSLDHCRVAVKLKSNQALKNGDNNNDNQNNNGLMNILVSGLTFLNQFEN
jgi:hypothetical protein